MRFALPLLAMLGFAPACALAAPVAITVIGRDGKPLAGAVVQVKVPRGPSAASRFSGPFVVAQKDIQFQPRILIVPAGASVSFPNRDKVRHHVYSFSTPKRFELKLYGQDETRAITFDQPGVVALGCNIHDAMSGIIIVTDTPFAALTDAAGRVSFPNVPEGSAVVTLWHSTIRAPGGVLTQNAAIGTNGLSTVLRLTRQ